MRTTISIRKYSGAPVLAKRAVLTYVAENEPATSAGLADALDYATQAGAAATLLRLHRHGHLRRVRDGPAYLYSISDKGRTWLSLFGNETGRGIP
jgi:hypothetical protein